MLLRLDEGLGESNPSNNDDVVELLKRLRNKFTLAPGRQAISNSASRRWQDCAVGRDRGLQPTVGAIRRAGMADRPRARGCCDDVRAARQDESVICMLPPPPKSIAVG